MAKMIFSDFDNTMLQIHSTKNVFSNYQLSVLKKVQDSGVSFSIVTGRCVYFFLNRFPELLEYVDYIIASNGAVIYDVKNNNYEIYHGEFYYKSVLHEEDVFFFSDKPKFFIRGGYGLDIETGTYTGYVLYCKNSRWVISVSNTPFQ